MRILTGVALAFFLAGAVYAQSVEIPVELTGLVRIGLGSRLPTPARVTLLRAGIPVVDRFTDPDGRFAFENLQPGSYVLEVRLGNSVVSERITLIGSREQIAVDIPIEAGRRAAGSATVAAADLLVPDRARKEIEEGRKLRVRSDCPKAIVRFQKALNLFESAAAAHYELGLCYRELGNPKAESELMRAWEISAEEEPALQLADFYNHNGRLNEASEVIRNALRKHSESGALYSALALASYKQGNIEETRRAAIMAHDRTRHFPDVHLLLAKIYEKEFSPEVFPQLRQFLQEEPVSSTTRRQVEDYLEKLQLGGRAGD